MSKGLGGNVTTWALTGCAVCHVWALIVVAREMMQDGFDGVGAGVSPALVLIYMVCVCLFNWFAVSCGGGSYHRAALILPAVHLAAALLQGAAAQALLASGIQNGARHVAVGVVLPAVLNLPMNSTHVIRQPGSVLPWLTAGFFAVNLAVAVFRLRRLPSVDKG